MDVQWSISDWGGYQGRRGLNAKLPGIKNLKISLKKWKAETHGFLFLLRLHSVVNGSMQWRTCDLFCSCEAYCTERGDLGKLKYLSSKKLLRREACGLCLAEGKSSAASSVDRGYIQNCTLPCSCYWDIVRQE